MVLPLVRGPTVSAKAVISFAIWKLTFPEAAVNDRFGDLFE